MAPLMSRCKRPRLLLNDALGEEPDSENYLRFRCRHHVSEPVGQLFSETRACVDSTDSACLRCDAGILREIPADGEQCNNGLKEKAGALAHSECARGQHRLLTYSHATPSLVQDV